MSVFSERARERAKALDQAIDDAWTAEGSLDRAKRAVFSLEKDLNHKDLAPLHATLETLEARQREIREQLQELVPVVGKIQ